MCMKQNKLLHNGFGLVETMLAAAMAGIIMTAAFVLYNNVLLRTHKNTSSITHVIPSLSVFLEVREKGLEPGEARYETRAQGPAMNQTYERKDVPEGSVLQRFKGLQHEVVTGTWQQSGREKSVKLAKYMFAPELEIEKKKEGQ